MIMMPDKCYLDVPRCQEEIYTKEVKIYPISIPLPKNPS